MTKEAEIVSRRGVMAGLAGTALAAGGAAVWALPTGWYDSKVAAVSASWWERRRWTLATAGSREWTRLLGGAFVLFAGGREIRLWLSEVNALPSPGTRPPEVSRKQAFVAVFDSRGVRLPVEDRIYRVAHVRYGDLQVYLKPFGDPSRPNLMEAVFN